MASYAKAWSACIQKSLEIKFVPFCGGKFRPQKTQKNISAVLANTILQERFRMDINIESEIIKVIDIEMKGLSLLKDKNKYVS